MAAAAPTLIKEEKFQVLMEPVLGLDETLQWINVTALT